MTEEEKINKIIREGGYLMVNDELYQELPQNMQDNPIICNGGQLVEKDKAIAFKEPDWLMSPDKSYLDNMRSMSNNDLQEFLNGVWNE